MHLQKTALVLEGGGMRGMFSAGVFEAFWRISSPFPTSPPFLPEPAIFYHICLPNRCAHVRLSNTTSPISVTSACATGLKAAASSALTLSSRSFPSSCSHLTMQPTVPIPACCRLLLPISLMAKASGTTRKQWGRTLFLCALLPPCLSLPL